MLIALRRAVVATAVVAATAVPTVGLTTPLAAAAPAAARSTASLEEPGPLQGPACDPGKLCAFDQAGFTGNRVDYYLCGPMRDVRQDGLARVGSFINNQTGDQRSTFYGEDTPHHWVPQFTSVAADASADTTEQVTRGIAVC